ncbi:MAG: DUF1450 domain-containing protein [Hydrogenibacillus sp.]|nr:DUF1450 domain-containing protein [Hydrogenibacillus sp.]
MYAIVEFCVSNLASGSQSVYDALSEEPMIDVVEYGCLSYCSECFLQPFALVNGKFVSAETPEALIQAIRRVIAAEDEEDAGGEADLFGS